MSLTMKPNVSVSVPGLHIVSLPYYQSHLLFAVLQVKTVAQPARSGPTSRRSVSERQSRKLLNVRQDRSRASSADPLDGAARPAGFHPYRRRRFRAGVRRRACRPTPPRSRRSPTIREPRPSTIRSQALELSGEALDRVSSIFWCRAGAHTNDTIQALEREISPKMSRHFSAISMNEKLFARIDALYRKRASLGLDAETLARAGKDLEGLCPLGCEARCRRQEAACRDQRGTVVARHHIRPERACRRDAIGRCSSMRPILPACPISSGARWPRLPRRAVRRAATRSPCRARSTSRSRPFPNGATCAKRRGGPSPCAARTAAPATTPSVVRDMLTLRAEKAKLLGYASYAALKLDDTMAKTPEGGAWPARSGLATRRCEKAASDQSELERLAAEAGSNETFAAWDWRFYQEKLRAEKFAFDEAELKPYLQLDRIIDACFDVATRLFGIRFEEKAGIAAWHPDVRVFAVKNADGSERGLFLADYFARPSKRSGAWMSSLQSGYRLGAGLDAGHLQHHELRQAAGRRAGAAVGRRGENPVPRIRPCPARHADRRDVAVSVSGTSVSRDFVELPSQLYEHWLTVPAVLEKHALHHQDRQADAQGAARQDAGGAHLRRRLRHRRVHRVRARRHGLSRAPGCAGRAVGFEAETRAENSACPTPSPCATARRISGTCFPATVIRPAISTCGRKCSTPIAFSAFEETGDPFNPGRAAAQAHLLPPVAQKTRKSFTSPSGARCRRRGDDGQARG